MKTFKLSTGNVKVSGELETFWNASCIKGAGQCPVDILFTLLCDGHIARWDSCKSLLSEEWKEPRKKEC